MKVLMLLIAAILIAGCSSQTQGVSVQDPYSINCSSGTFAVFNGSNFSCESPRICESDSDCQYLNVNQLPPRYGKCIFGTCKASCGSGVIHPCVN